MLEGIKFGELEPTNELSIEEKTRLIKVVMRDIATLGNLTVPENIVVQALPEKDLKEVGGRVQYNSIADKYIFELGRRYSSTNEDTYAHEGAHALLINNNRQYRLMTDIGPDYVSKFYSNSLDNVPISDSETDNVKAVMIGRHVYDEMVATFYGSGLGKLEDLDKARRARLFEIALFSMSEELDSFEEMAYSISRKNDFDKITRMHAALKTVNFYSKISGIVLGHELSTTNYNDHQKLFRLNIDQFTNFAPQVFGRNVRNNDLSKSIIEALDNIH